MDYDFTFFVRWWNLWEIYTFRSEFVTHYQTSPSPLISISCSIPIVSQSRQVSGQPLGVKRPKLAPLVLFHWPIPSNSLAVGFIFLFCTCTLFTVGDGGVFQIVLLLGKFGQRTPRQQIYPDSSWFVSTCPYQDPMSQGAPSADIFHPLPAICWWFSSVVPVPSGRCIG